MKDTPRMMKFGTITENADGVLEFRGFSIDCNFSNARVEEVLLTLVIARLQSELDIYRRKK